MALDDRNRLIQSGADPAAATLASQTSSDGSPYALPVEITNDTQEPANDGTAPNELFASSSPVINAAYLYRGDNSFDRERTPTVFRNFFAAPAVLWTPAEGKRIRLMGGWLSGSAAGLYHLADANTETVILSFILEANKPFALPPLGNGLLLDVDVIIGVINAGGGSLTGCLFGTEESD